MLKINFNQELVNFDGTSLRETQIVNLIEEGGQIRKEVLQGKELTLKSVCVAAVSGKFSNEELDPEKQVERFMLAYKIFNSDDEGLEMKDTETVLIKQLLAKTNYTPLVVGQACKMINEGGKSETPS